jgi:hypothetical protein
MPPRYLKSLLASVAFPAWCLGHDPAAQILCVSYAQELADKLSRDCRRILASDWYRRIFPTRLSPERQAVPEFETTAQGCRLATSVGGVLTGRGADMICHSPLDLGPRLALACAYLITRGRKPGFPRKPVGASQSVANSANEGAYI